MAPTAGLAALNFFLADVQGGLGPFLATWLATTGWNAERVGIVMTISGLVGLLFNSPAGFLIDSMPRFRVWVALASLAIVAGTLATWAAHDFGAVLAAQIASALGGALTAPAVTALTLGIVGKSRFPNQQGRNQAWNHAGNVAAAGLVAVATFVLGAASAFWVLAGMAAATVVTLIGIPAGAVDVQRASGRMPETHGTMLDMLSNRPLLLLGAALLLFHLGNAAMLPLLGQRMAELGHGNATRWMAACVIGSARRRGRCCHVARKQAAYARLHEGPWLGPAAA